MKTNNKQILDVLEKTLNKVSKLDPELVDIQVYLKLLKEIRILKREIRREELFYKLKAFTHFRVYFEFNIKGYTNTPRKGEIYVRQFKETSYKSYKDILCFRKFSWLADTPKTFKKEKSYSIWINHLGTFEIIFSRLRKAEVVNGYIKELE